MAAFGTLGVARGGAFFTDGAAEELLTAATLPPEASAPPGDLRRRFDGGGGGGTSSRFSTMKGALGVLAESGFLTKTILVWGAGGTAATAAADHFVGGAEP